MKIEDKVITLDQAKELKALGVKQESQYFWACVYNKTDNLKSETISEGNQDKFRSLFLTELNPGKEVELQSYSAFDLPELLQMIPEDSRDYPKGVPDPERQSEFISAKHLGLVVIESIKQSLPGFTIEEINSRIN